MNNAYVVGAAGAGLITYFLLCVMFTIDLAYSDDYSTKKKYMLFAAIWLLPIIGAIWFYNQQQKLKNHG